MEEIEIRLAEESDIPDILYLANEWTPIDKESQELRLEKLKSTFHIKGHEFYVACKANKTVGYMEIWIHECWFPLRFVVYIEFIYVHPNHRNQKIGTKLIEHIKEKYKHKFGLPNMWIYAEGIVTDFYVQNGFRKTDINFYLIDRRDK